MTAREAPLLLVTGAPAAGKTTLVANLAGTIKGAAVFDTDVFGDAAHHDWTLWATSWLIIDRAVYDNALVPLLCGYGLHRSLIDALPHREALGRSHCLYLDVPEATLRARLLARDGFDEVRIARKLAQASELRADADDVIETGGLSPLDVSDAVRDWIRSHMPTS